MAINLCVFTGNMGKDAVQRFTQSGDSVVQFSLPVKSGYGDKAKTSWINCSLWGKRGESVFPYLKKGTLVGVSGEWSMNEYTDKEGQKRASPELRVAELALLGGKPEGQKSGGGSGNAPQLDRPKQADSTGFDDMSDDIPFLCHSIFAEKAMRKARY